MLEIQYRPNGSTASSATNRWWLSVDHCVHLIDDDCHFLQVAGSVLECADLRVERYPSAERFLTTHSVHDSDCVLLDMRMPNMTGIELLTTLRSNHESIPVLMLSAYSDTAGVVQAMQNGASDYLVKPIDEQELLRKVSAALHRNWSEKQRQADAFQRLSSLSEREREVMDLFAAAKTTRQVANELGISPKTVEKHRLNIFEKLNIDSVPALIRLLFDVRWIGNPQ